MRTADIKEYRQNYYQENRDYLLEYSKWYYSQKKYMAGEIDISEVKVKPIRKKEDTNEQNIIKIKKGEFTVVFE